MDDTTMLVEGANLSEAFDKLMSMMMRQGGRQQWADEHECSFAMDKF